MPQVMALLIIFLPGLMLRKCGSDIQAIRKSSHFYDMDKYKYKINSSSDLKKTINLTADYYRQSDNTNDVTMGFVKGMIEVVIQEE